MITREFKLYLNAGVGVAPVINANQFDQSEEWVFTLLQSDGTVYTPSTGAIIGLKQDGTTILNAGTVNSSGQVVITETEQMTAVPGSNLFEILIDGNTHGTANFVVFVERRPGDIDNPSESDISLFQEAIEAAGNVTQFQADIAELKSDVDDLEEADTSLASQIAQEASTRQTQDGVLQAEIDQIIAPSGEAPSAAEVENARIGVDGTTYDTLGNAIRGQVSDIKNALDSAISIVTNIANPANKVLNERYKGTDPVTTGAESNYQRLEVPVIAGKIYSIWHINTSFSFFSDSNNTKLGVISSTGNVTIPTGCTKLLLSFQNQTKEFVVINAGGYPDGTYQYNKPLEVEYKAFDIYDYEDDIEIIASVRNIANPTEKVLNERYRNANPVDTASQAGYQRLEVPVIAGKTYSVWNINTAFSMFSNDSNTNLGVISSEGNITTPAGCTKLLLTYSAQNKEFIVINGKDYPNGTYTYNQPIEADDAHYDYTSVSMFPSIGVVGDSFESGGIYINEQTLWGMFYDLSWVAVMGRRCGSNMNNYSSAGLSTRTWLTNVNRGLAKALADDPSGLYLLCLGINDYGLENYLGTIADITNDYTQNPDTFYGNYARIFEQLQAHAPNAKFIFVVPPLITSEYANAIEAIAEHYSVPSFRSLNDDFFKSDFYTNNKGTAHPVAMTYAGMALAYERLVSLCIQDNETYFYDYHAE